VHAVPAALFRELSQTEAPQGILGVAAEPRTALPPPASAGSERCLVLDAVQDPGNVGTLVRTAAALGVTRVVALDGTTDPWGAKAVRASAGLVFALPVHVVSWAEASAWIASVAVPLLVASAGGDDLRAGAPSAASGPGSGWALLLGNEGQGARPEAAAAASARLAIPMVGGVESLNVATAGAILLWALGPGRADPSRAASPRA
jgi:TrmH family RNA methyltransferase